MDVGNASVVDDRFFTTDLGGFAAFFIHFSVPRSGKYPPGSKRMDNDRGNYGIGFLCGIRALFYE